MSYIYLDNFLGVEVLADNKAKEALGQATSDQLTLRGHYGLSQVPRGDDKAVCGLPKLGHLGYRLNGVVGLLHYYDLLLGRCGRQRAVLGYLADLDFSNGRRLRHQVSKDFSLLLKGLHSRCLLPAQQLQHRVM